MTEDTENQPELTKEEKFIKLANNRYVRAEKQISLLKNLTAHAYEMNAEVAERVLTDLEKEVADLRKQWENRLSGPRKRRNRKADSAIAVTSETEIPNEDVVEGPVAETAPETAETENPNAVLAALTSEDNS